MGENHLRRCTWLKFVVHVIMAMAFAAFLFFVVVFFTFIGSRFSSTRSKESLLEVDFKDSDFFASQMFVDVYGEYIDELCSGLETIEYGESSGYPLSAFMENNVNFKYAVYDTEGKLKYASEGFDTLRMKNYKTADTADALYYYTIDMSHLNLFNVKIIRQADFVKEVSSKGLLEYGSNFAKYTSFYTYDESFLADSIGYICTYVPGELQSGDRIYDNYQRFIRWACVRGARCGLGMDMKDVSCENCV